MGFKDRTKQVAKPFVDYKTWMSVDEHKGTWQKLLDSARAIFFVDIEPTREESFEEAVERLHLSPSAIQTKQRQCLIIAALFFIAGIASAVYTFALLLKKEFAASFLGFGVTALLLAFAFRYHFWYFQIKNRKLGCTIADWWGSKLKG